MGCGSSSAASGAAAPKGGAAAAAPKPKPMSEENKEIAGALPALTQARAADPEVAAMQRELDDEMEKLLNMEEIVHDKEDAKKEARVMFDKYDADKSGKLEVKELHSYEDTPNKNVLQKLGLDFSKAQFEAYALSMLKDFDKDGDLTLDFPEFYKFYYKCMRTEEIRAKYATKLNDAASADAATLKDAHKAFDKYDKDKSKSIDIKELDKVLRETLKGLDLTEEQWKHYTKDIMARGDKDKSGKLEFEEFYNLYKKTIATPEIRKKYQQKVLLRYEDGKWQAS